MSSTTKIGIWMDHSIAYLMELTTGLVEKVSIESVQICEDDIHSLAKEENYKQVEEQYKQSAYYKKLREAINNSQDIILFGPSYAKVKLYNMLRADKRFEKTKIEIKQAGEMNENQLFAFVKKHFANRLF
ncbi:hypothetical protein [Parasediminibacterium sp. JCM 36343]|uniref:hypothetical protein n=1 Tax=Parasediminibacterium sp. JCM 36343 TaxID=3374279 RepID=UPI003978B592